MEEEDSEANKPLTAYNGVHVRSFLSPDAQDIGEDNDFIEDDDITQSIERYVSEDKKRYV